MTHYARADRAIDKSKEMKGWRIGVPVYRIAARGEEITLKLPAISSLKTHRKEKQSPAGWPPED